MGFYNKLKELETYLDLPIEEQMAKAYEFQPDEPGVIHPETGATLRFMDSGTVHLTAGHKGNADTPKKDPMMFRLNADTGSSSLFAKQSHFFNNITHFHTSEDGFRINNHQLNPKALSKDYIYANDLAFSFLQTLLSTGYTAPGGVPMPPTPGAMLFKEPVFKEYETETDKAISSLKAFTKEMGDLFD